MPVCGVVNLRPLAPVYVSGEFFMTLSFILSTHAPSPQLPEDTFKDR